MKKFVSVLLAIIIVFSFASTASARLVGDIDSNGKVNSSDALLILRKSVGYPENINTKYADINGDGRINSADALVVLNIAVGNYDGELEVEDELVTSYKKDVIDPIMSSGKFTLKTEAAVKGRTAVATTMIRDKDICVEAETEGVKIRLLSLDSKTYLIMPDFILPGVGVYMPYDQEIKPVTGNNGDVTYVKSEYVDVNGEKLVCETYTLKDGRVSEYYFKDGKWVMLSVISDEETVTQKVLEFKKGVKESYFSLKGFVEISDDINLK